MSNLPPSMRAQVKAANAMQAAIAAGTDPFANQPPPVAPITIQAAVTPPGAVPQAPAGTIIDPGVPDGFKPVDLTRPAAPAPAAAAPQPPTNPSQRWVPASQASAAPAVHQPAPAQPAAAAPPQGAQPVSNDGDQRYKVLQGKYNTETRQLRGEVNQLSGQVQDLIVANRTLMTALQQRPTAAPAAPPAPKTVRERALAVGWTEKEIDEYGEDLVGVMLRTAENIAGPQIAQLRRENAQLAGTVQNTRQAVVQDAEQRFWSDLEALVPEWADINQSQEWLDWLQQADVFSGRTRNDGLQDAFRTHDARRVAGIMNAFKAEDARAPTAGSHVDPATLVAPGQTGGGTPAPAGMNLATDKPIWTEEQVSLFYSDKRRGKVKGQEAAAIEAEINQALREGRIKPAHNDAYLINSR